MLRIYETPKNTAEISASAVEMNRGLFCSETSISKDEAKTFWDNVFQASPFDEIANLTDEELISIIFDRSEDEFSFEFAVDDELKDIISDYCENWGNFSDEEKKEAISVLVAKISHRLELKETPDIRYYDDDSLSYGAYNQYSNTIELNESKLDSFGDVIDTIPHELRHAYQNQCAKNPQTTTDVLYKINFDNYIVPEKNWDGSHKNYFEYYNQLVEVEARAFAKLFSDGGVI